MSIKLWIILFTLRELIKFVQQKLQENTENESSSKNAMELFAKNFLNVSANSILRTFEESFFRQAILSFPYKQSMVFHSLKKNLESVPFNSPPSTYFILAQALFGHRFVETANFCLTCGISSAVKQCKNCKVFIIFYYKINKTEL